MLRPSHSVEGSLALNLALKLIYIYGLSNLGVDWLLLLILWLVNIYIHESHDARNYQMLIKLESFIDFINISTKFDLASQLYKLDDHNISLLHSLEIIYLDHQCSKEWYVHAFSHAAVVL